MILFERRAFGALALLLAMSCRGGEGNGLPPAEGKSAPPPPAIPKLSEVASAQPAGAADDRAAWTGTLYARNEAQLGPKMTGILNQITVEEGDHVKKGKLLFRLDGAQASLSVDQGKAAVASAQVGLDAAKIELSRATELAQRGSIAPASFDQAKAAYDRAATALDQAKAALAVGQHGLTDTAVYSPIDGVVTAKLKNVGETVTMMPPTVVLVVQDVDKLELRAHLPEKTLGNLEKGSMLHMSIPTLGISHDVPVKRVNPTIDPRTRTVEVVADVDNANGKLKVGMLAEVSVTEKAVSGKTSAADEKIANVADPGGKSP